ncbi:capsular exopolysaccharide family [Enhydrobacter aerosaccus]|uniref:non-specific protein-tyrosine kinase n=1 Tax=Enhydrobacter aerosaccus TaxID=225324 RepID=A0A1T4T9W4_9HYPH|nr:polysaccharide biosynthesis tyrosine autokinase [Enhydrobacter aerosaccus]SKA37252.1 capsular exopolysaccharide family [Enhydrobacter aerosaccus]
MGPLPKIEHIADDADLAHVPAGADALGPAGRVADSGNELWEWLRLLNRRKALIVGAGLVAVAIMALIIAQQTPLYKASARIMLDTRTFKVVSTEPALSGVDTLNMGAIQSELEVIQSEFLIGRVVDRLGLASNPDFNGTKPPGFLEATLDPIRQLWRSGVSSLLAPPPPARPAQAPAARRTRSDDSDPARRAAIATVASHLQVSLLGRTFVIVITVESPDGTMSARIANAIAEVYLADQVDNKNEANRRATEWLEERLAELRRNLQVAEEAVATYRRDKGLAGSPEGGVSTQTLSDLNSKYLGAKTRRIEKEARLVALSKASLNPNEVAGITEVAGNATLNALRTQELDLNRKIAELSTQFGPNHPKLIQARSELAAVHTRFLQQMESITLAIRAELDAAKAEEEEMKAQVERASVLSGATSQYEAELKQLEREAQSNRALYESFLNRFKELREQQDIQRADARILSYAWPSTTPSSPQYKTGLFAAFIVGCLLGMAGAIAAEKLDRVFRSASQVEKATGVAVLGMIPLVKSTIGQRANIVTQVVDRTTSSAAEAMRAVFTAISLSNLDRPARIIAVTSSTPGEGKTTFSAALGGLLTKMNASRRVLLVDLDLRQAKLAVALGLKDRGGTIDEYLMGTKTLDECIHRHEASGVDYICARAETPNAPEVLESHAMKAALATFADRYDLVILDSPPVMAVSDARIVSQLADYTIFVLHWAKTPRDVVKSAVSALLSVTDRVGIVINKVNLAKHAMYEYGDYGDYYSRYRGYYGAAYGGGAGGGAPPANGPSSEAGGIAKLTRIVPKMK